MSDIDSWSSGATARGIALLALLLAGCAPYVRSDIPTPRRAGGLDALASLVGGCDAPRPGDPGAGRPESTPGEERRERRRCAASEDRTAATPTPSGPVQKKP